MMKKLFLFTVAAAFMACQPKTSENTDAVVESNPLEINCDGIGAIKMSFTHADVVNAVGEENMVEGTRTEGENTLHTTTLFQDNPEEIIIYWAETEAPFNTITEIRLEHNYSPYTLDNGLKVGATLDELRTLNNFQPILMTNFYNNLDGYADVTSFSEGDLGSAFPCLNVKLDIVKQKGLDVGIRDAAKEQDILKSSDRIFSMLDVEVHSISIKR